MMQEADAIFAMDFQNKAELVTLYPDSGHKVFMLRACLQDSSQMEIPDPYFGNVEHYSRLLSNASGMCPKFGG